MKRLFALSIALFGALSLMAQSYVAQMRPADSKEWGYMKIDGEWMYEPQFRKCFAFSEDGMAAVIVDKKLMLIDAEGNKIEPTEKGLALNQGKRFCDGLIAVKNKAKLSGYLNKKGEVAIPLKYHDVTKFDGGFAVARLNGISYVINTKGEEMKVAVDDMNEIKPFSEGLAPMKRSSGKFGFINTKGEVAIEAKFLSVGYFSNGMAWARGENDKIGFIDKEGDWVLEPKFQTGKSFDKESGLARVKLNDKWGYTDAEGNMIFMPETTKWDDFSDGLALGRKDDKVGFFNSKEEWVITPKYEAAKAFKNGYARVKMNGLWGMIDKEGTIVIPCEYAGIKNMEKL